MIFKTRLVEEQVQLEDKLNKLKSFIEGDKFESINDTQKKKALLKVQANAMSTYNQCLKERLERL